MRDVGLLLGPIPAISLPAIKTLPSEGSKKPEMARSNVVLPHPEGPKKLKNSPPLIVISAFFTAVKSSNLTVSNIPSLIFYLQNQQILLVLLIRTY